MFNAEITRNNIITGRCQDGVSTLGFESISPVKKSHGPNFDGNSLGSAGIMSDVIEGTGFVEETQVMSNVFTWKDPKSGDTKVTVVQTLVSGVTSDMCVLTLPPSYHDSEVSQELSVEAKNIAAGSEGKKAVNNFDKTRISTYAETVMKGSDFESVV